MSEHQCIYREALARVAQALGWGAENWEAAVVAFEAEQRARDQQHQALANWIAECAECGHVGDIGQKDCPISCGCKGQRHSLRPDTPSRSLEGEKPDADPSGDRQEASERV